MEESPDLVVPLGAATAAALVAGAAGCLALPWLLPWPASLGLLLLGTAGWWARRAWLQRCAHAWLLPGRAGLRVGGALLVGFGLCGLHAAHALGAQLPVASERGDFAIRGRVVELPWHEAARTRFVFVVDDEAGIAPFLRGKRLRLAWYDHDARRGRASAAGHAPVRATIEPGSRWQLRVRLRAPRGLRNPGTLDSEKHAFAQRVSATGYVRDEASARRLSPAAGIDAWRDRRAARIVVAVPQASSRFVRALALGDTRGLTELDWEILRATGLTHLIAISGFHVGLVAGFFALLAGGLWRALPRLGLWMPRPQVAA
ncbi:MAG TPA: ComEC/Rec2 family competence protein, partial [Luteimonas sp.]|nr:ComEC/Rec2 family competence protein [Luteimonas sp.]